MKNSEDVMEHLKTGTPTPPLHNAIYIFQDITNYKFEEHLTDFTFPSQSQIDSPDGVGCTVYLRSEHEPCVHETFVQISLKGG